MNPLGLCSKTVHFDQFWVSVMVIETDRLLQREVSLMNKENLTSLWV